MLKRVHTFVKSIVTDEVEETRQVSDNPRYTNDPDADAGEDDDANDEDEERGQRLDGFMTSEQSRKALFGGGDSLLFAETIAEKRRLRAEKVAEAAEELKVLDEQANVKKAEVELELEKEFDKFFNEAVSIVKQTRAMEEAKLLERLGHESQDTFDGKFGFGDVKHGQDTVDDVSNIFRPRIEAGYGHFHQNDDDIDFLWMCMKRRKMPINYNPLVERDFVKLQRFYPGLRKFFSKQTVREDMFMDASDVWLGDSVSMKLLAEYIWRHTDAIMGFDAEGAKGFEKRNCLMVMQALKECRTLKTLNFKDTKMCHEGSAAAALIAKVSTDLEVASLMNTSTQDAGACFWGLALSSGCPNLQALDLSNCKIGPSGATALAIGLSKHQGLRLLNLSKNRVDREGCRRIGEALLVNPTLEDLDLSANSIGSRGAASIAAFVIHPNCRLKTLTLSGNDIGRRGGRALAVGMSFNKSITKLILAHNDLGDPGAAGFGICLQRNNTLRILDLTDCDITDLGTASVALGLKTNNTLRSLNLSDQIVADSGCEHIAMMLSENPDTRLKILNLSNNGLRDQAAVALAKMLETNSRLEELLLNDNEIQNVGAKALGLVLSSDKNKTLTTLDVSENPISEEVALNYFAKAEHRLVTQKTARIDVLAQGTTMARNNLRGCGVIILRTEMTTFYAIVYSAMALVGGWFDFGSDILVAYTTMSEAIYQGGSWVYAVLIAIFVVFPFFYVIIVFSLSEEDSDVTADVGGKDRVNRDDSESEAGMDDHGKSIKTGNKKKLMDGSSLLFGSTFGPESGVSFKDHLKRVWSSKFGLNRLFLLVVNATQTRLAYEVYLSWKQGLSTLALSSIRLTDTIFEAMPQSILQLHILFSSVTLHKIQSFGGLVGPDNDFSVLVLVTSVSFSVSVLSNTLSGLYEEKFVVNWKRVALANEDLAFWIGFFISYFYHIAHYLFRAITVVLVASIYEPLLAAGFYAFGLSMRLLIWFVTKSERRKLFAVVSYLVGSAAWDTRKAARAAFLMELLETLIVIPPLWMSREVIQANIANSPLAFQTNWLAMVDIVGPIFFTAIIYGTGLVALILYFGFIERIHTYSDVKYEVDPAEAQELAESPFEEHQEIKRKAKRHHYFMGGTGMLASLSSSMYSSASNLKSGKVWGKKRASKKRDARVAKVEETDEA